MTKPKINRVENVVAYMMVGVLGTSILTILVILVAYLMKFTKLPALLALIPMIGLPLGALLLIALLIIMARKRAKEGK